MYRYLDRPADDLTWGEQLILRAVRDWTAAARCGRCPVDAVTLRFLSHRFVGGLEPFHEALHLLSCHGRQRLELGCPCHPTVTEGEAILLALIFPADGLAANTGPQLAALARCEHRPRLAERLGELRAALAGSGLA